MSKKAKTVDETMNKQAKTIDKTMNKQAKTINKTMNKQANTIDKTMNKQAKAIDKTMKTRQTINKSMNNPRWLSKHPVGYTSFPVGGQAPGFLKFLKDPSAAKQAPRWLHKLPNRWTSPRGLEFLFDSPSAILTSRRLD